MSRHCNLVGKVGVAMADGCLATVKLLKDSVPQGFFLQKAGGQGIEAVQQVHNALTGGIVTKDLPVSEPLVTAKDVGSPEAKAKLKRVFPHRPAATEPGHSHARAAARTARAALPPEFRPPSP